MVNFFGKLVISALLVLPLNSYATVFYSQITRGVITSEGYGPDYYTITITGGDIHSVHVTGIDATGWDIYDGPKHLFSPTWYAASAKGGPGGFSWNIGQNKNTAPDEFKFHVPYNDEGNGVHLSSSNISVDLADGTILPTTPVPEPEEWAMMLIGFGMVSHQIKRKQKGRKAD